MLPERMQELIVILLIENRCCIDEGEFSEYLLAHYNMDGYNDRYIKLLDEFLNEYASNKTEKSE